MLQNADCSIVGNDIPRARYAQTIWFHAEADCSSANSGKLTSRKTGDFRELTSFDELIRIVGQPRRWALTWQTRWNLRCSIALMYKNTGMKIWTSNTFE
jgi:hypothetical protein